MEKQVMKRMIAFYGDMQFAMFPVDNYVIPEWAAYFVVFEFNLD